MSNYLDWNEVAEGWEAECFDSGNRYLISGADDSWHLNATVAGETYNFPFVKRQKAFDMADELEVQS